MRRPFGGGQVREPAARLAGRVALWAFVGAVGLVALVGVVGLVARTAGTWRWLFRFEQTASAAVPLGLALVGIGMVGAVGAVALTPVD